MDIQNDQARSSNLYDQLIDQYKLEAHISQTAITDLYRAFDVDENRAVAVEILLPTFNNKKQYVEQFIEKMHKVAQLKHPNIAQVHQIGLTPNDRAYVARDLVEGITLRERLLQLSRQTVPANSIYALQIVQQMAEALELAERLDLYHYHLTPDNIMIKQDGTVVLVDLGVPAAENGTAVKAKADLNLDYVAPEQKQGRVIDSRSQIFSLGVILHEILTGQLPEQSFSFWQTFLQTVRPQNTILEQERPDLSRQTHSLVEKCLRKQPWGRFNTIKEFLEAIKVAMQNERMQAQTQKGETGSVLAAPLPRRPRALILVPFLVVAVLIGAIAIWAAVQNQNARQEETLPVAAAPVESVTVTPTPTLQQTPTPLSQEEPSPIAALNPDTIDILAPPNATEYQVGDTADFRWSWGGILEETQHFSVYLLSANGRSLLGIVNTQAADGNYSLQTALPGSFNEDMSEWHVVLEDSTTNREIITSNNWQISIKPIPETPTFTPSPTETASPTNTATPTPIPQVEIVLSSASLREGPGTIYQIISFLFQGEIVAVLAKDSLEGEWYNVILDDGTTGWLAASTSRLLDENSLINIPIAATIPPRPTNTPTSTPTNTATPTFTPIPGSGDGGGNPQPTSEPTSTPPPPPDG